MSLRNYFKLDENKTDLKTELIAGITTFLAMSYILGVAPNMLRLCGMPITGVFFATAVASGVSCIIMGLISRYPIGIAPGMPINALFTFTIVLKLGVSWKAALAAVFISSVMFFIITILGLREKVLDAFPKNLKLAIGAGIGFFLAFIGLKGAGIIVSNPNTIVSLGSLLAAPAFVALIGIMITIYFYVKEIPAAVFLGLIITAIIGLIATSFGLCPNSTAASLMPHIPTQVISTSFDVSLFGSFIEGFRELFTLPFSKIVLIICSFLFVMFFDATGTLISLANQCGLIDEDGNTKGIKKAFLADALAGIIGAIFGTSTLNAYAESGTGISLGGKTGLTAIFIGIFFLLSVFFAPLILSIFTSSVTCAALVITSILMMSQLKDIDWDNFYNIAPVFITIIMILLTYSISLGIAWGFLTFTVVEIARGKWKNIPWLVWVLTIIFLIYLFFGL